jgi:hypothetical protein
VIEARIRLGAGIAVAAFWLGCTWVPLSEGGEQVQLVSAKAVEECRQIGKTNAKTRSKVMFFARGESTIRGELQSLARNDAAKMGGTTVAPLGPAVDGEQPFGIYVCGGG